MGTIMVFSASYPYALSYKGDGLFYIKKQVVFAVLGIAAMIAASYIPYRFYRDFSWAIYGVSCILLVLVLIMGLSAGGAQRWLAIPGTSIQLQPSELMKAALPIMLAWYYDKYRKQVLDRSSLVHSFVYSIGIPLIFLGIACALVLAEKHLSGTLILAAIGFVVMYLGGAHLGILIGSGGVFLSAAALYISLNSYARQRVETLVGDSADNLSDRWQVNQGLYAIGNGGIMGVGLGESVQKNSYVSQAQNDFIFTIWCEEMGFVGAVVVILVFCALVWRGYTIAKKAPDTFSSLVVFGIVSQVGIQAFLNMCVVTELIPNTGISLPFFSYGGTSLVVLMAEMGIILSVSRQSYLKK
jgi:cell division protein FtsW